MTLFAYPQKAAFGRVLPKTKIYQYAGPSTAMKKLFVNQVDQFAWAYKLAPETINITNGILAVCAELGIGLVPYSPLGKGFLTGAIGKETRLGEGDFRNMLPRFTPAAVFNRST